MIDKKALIDECKALRWISIRLLEQAMNADGYAFHEDSVRKIVDLSDAFRVAISTVENQPGSNCLAKEIHRHET